MLKEGRRKRNNCSENRCKRERERVLQKMIERCRRTHTSAE